jgi:hypothetical protein
MMSMLYAVLDSCIGLYDCRLLLNEPDAKQKLAGKVSVDVYLFIYTQCALAFYVDTTSPQSATSQIRKATEVNTH